MPGTAKAPLARKRLTIASKAPSLHGATHLNDCDDLLSCSAQSETAPKIFLLILLLILILRKFAVGRTK